TKTAACSGVPKWTTAHLPDAYKLFFPRYFCPLLRSMHAARAPWASIHVEDVQAIFDAFEMEEVAEIGGVWMDLGQYRLNDSHTKLAKAAIVRVTELFDQDEFLGDDLVGRAERIRAYVEHAITEVGVGKDKSAPMHWQRWGDGTHKTGFLQTDLILATFSIHLQETECTLPDDSAMPLRDHPRPVAKLIISAQAVQRALGFFSTGEFVAPKQKNRKDDFSANNYGDYQERNEKGKLKSKNRATKWVKTLTNWTPATWERVVANAAAWLPDTAQSKSVSAATTPAASEAESASDSDSDGSFIIQSDDEAFDDLGIGADAYDSMGVGDAVDEGTGEHPSGYAAV
ncbi:hypothetical protein BD626DRAFT_411132, partial [Schizophyllum amplum]